MMLRDGVRPAAIARECGLPAAAIEGWLSGRNRSDDMERRIAQFLEDRALIWAVIEERGAPIRYELATKLVENLEALQLGFEIEDAQFRLEVRDQAAMYLRDLRRLIDLIGAGEEQEAAALVNAIRAILAPGDRLLIARGAGKEKA